MLRKTCIAQAIVVATAATLHAAPAFAGKVNMPKEGNFAFLFCNAGDEQALSAGDKVTVSHYRLIAATLSEPAGKAFDRMSALCYGTYAILNGRHQDFGVCEMVDQDDDKWWMEFHGNANGEGGTYTSAHGTGKYEGMTVKGQYTMDNWPSAAKGTFTGCNPNKGTYKLK